VLPLTLGSKLASGPTVADDCTSQLFCVLAVFQSNYQDRQHVPPRCRTPQSGNQADTYLRLASATRLQRKLVRHERPKFMEAA
jgi:hypothetical protein